ncbi:MAG: Periplasmic serine endoprotease DegP precursor [Deltaproteobacteria bacterium ADurb.Bin510]|nr:MAG: Periplasmic serine endoprotease DegP precursor [Deltaproteobacteria bacterium ADurb.Bin510]
MRSRIVSLLAILLFMSVNVQAAAPQGEWVADTAARVLPSVVNIYAVKTVSVPSFNPFTGYSGGTLRPVSGSGSGVIVSSDGYIITNYHVVAGFEQIQAKTSDGRVLNAKVVGADPKSDIALIKVSATNLRPVKIGDAHSLRIGQFVLAVGNAFGLGQTVTMGIVSALGRTNLGINEYEYFIQTDAAINPGNSGGALVNMDGELVGINSAILSRSGGNEGVGLAIPVDLAMSVKDSLLRYGRVVRGWFGVEVQDLNPALARSLKLNSSNGALVTNVMNGSPAAKAGLRPGDVITAINGRAIVDASSLRLQAAQLKPGVRATLSLMRDGQALNLAMVAGDQAQAASQDLTIANNRFFSGVSVGELGAQQKAKGLKGVLVTNVDANRATIDLRRGDIILAVNKQPVTSLTSFKNAAGQVGRILRLTINRQGVVVTMTYAR